MANHRDKINPEWDILTHNAVWDVYAKPYYSQSQRSYTWNVVDYAVAWLFVLKYKNNQKRMRRAVDHWSTKMSLKRKGRKG